MRTDRDVFDRDVKASAALRKALEDGPPGPWQKNLIGNPPASESLYNGMTLSQFLLDMSSGLTDYESIRALHDAAAQLSNAASTGGEIEILPPESIYDDIIIPRRDLPLSTHPSVCGESALYESSLNQSSLNQSILPHREE